MTLRARLGRLESAARSRTPLVWDLFIKASAGKVPLTDDEKASIAPQLSSFLAYAEQVQQVATSGVPPTSHPFGGASEWRDDEPQPSLPREDALAQAPDADRPHGLFKVPRVIG